MLKIAFETDDTDLQTKLLSALSTLSTEVPATRVNGSAVEDDDFGEDGVTTPVASMKRKVTKKKRGRPPKNHQPEPLADEMADEGQAVLEQAAEAQKEPPAEGVVQTKAEQITKDLLMNLCKTYIGDKGVDAMKAMFAKFDATVLSEVGEPNWPALWDAMEAEL